jgi:integrase
MMMIGIFNG